MMYNELNFYSLKWFLSLCLKLSHYKIDVFTFLTLDVNVNAATAVTAAEVAPPGGAGRRRSRRARLVRGAAQQKPFVINRP